jgi:ribosomal protein S12 methylthiotransferase accessory factor
LEPHLPRLDITRVGDLTGLDVIGIPVAFAVRPNSRSLSVAQGKSLDLDEARLGAVMECLEQVFGERAEDLVVARCTRRELRATGKRDLDLSDVLRVSRAPGDDEVVAWSAVTSLISGDETYVPFELVGLDFRIDMDWRFSDASVSSVGLAAGASWEAAATHALLEVLEHNSTAVVDVLGFLPGLARPVRYRSGTDAKLDRIHASIAEAGLSYELFDISARGGLPVVAALVTSPDLAPQPIRFAGFACRFSPEHAAEAALLEAVQSRLTLIAGARDDLHSADYTGGPTAPPRKADAALFLDEMQRSHSHLRHASPKKQLRAAIDTALGLGASDVHLARIGRIDDLASVVRIVASGLEASGFNATATLSTRTLTAILAAAGNTP